MPSEWHCVTVAESAVFALAGFGLSVADGWPVVPTAALAVVGLCVCVSIPDLLLSTTLPTRVAQGTALIMLVVVVVAIVIDYVRDDTNVTLFLFAPRWDTSSWQLAARARALLVALPAALISAACLRGASAEAQNGARQAKPPALPPTWPRLASWAGAGQVVVAHMQLVLAENESRFGGVSSTQLLVNSYVAIRDWALIFVFILMFLELITLVVVLFTQGVAVRIVATVMSVLNFAFCVTAVFVLWPPDYTWINFTLAMLQLCALAWDVSRFWRGDFAFADAVMVAPTNNSSNWKGQEPTQTAYAQPPYAPYSPYSSYSYSPYAPYAQPSQPQTQQFGAPFKTGLQPLYKDSLEKGIQQATRFARQHTRAARIRKVKDV